jgi:hypothetical protein
VQFRLLGDRYAGLVTAFHAIPLYLPIAKIVHVLAMPKFGGYDFEVNGTFRDHGDIQPRIKKRRQRLILFY